jgi:peptidoglycan/xylan/chitin deacetylase (PgdA/CDA1 family)
VKPLRRVARFASVFALLAAGAYLAYERLEDPESQFFGRTVFAGPAGERLVALTFDDGPNPPYTDRILDVLKRERVHATFFLVGRAVAAYPATVRRIIREGHAVGNHTWDHGHLVVETPAAIRRELAQTDAALAAAAGVHTRLMRPPFGARDFEVLDEARKEGYTVVMWSVPLPNDWEQPGDGTIARRVVDRAGDGAIIVLHDGNRGLLCSAARLPPATCDRSQDAGATREIVETLRSRGFRFVTVPELLVARNS